MSALSPLSELDMFQEPLDDPVARQADSAVDPAARRDLRIVAAALVASAIYATARYNVFKHVPWADWPSHILNKVLALSALVLIGVSVVRLVRPHLPIRRLMAWAGGLTSVHVLLSLALMRPEYFEKLFADGKLTLLAGWSMLLGAAAFALLEIGARRSPRWRPGLRTELLALIALLSGVHAALPSVASWFAPATWPGGMPPITLISFVIGTGAWLAIRFRTGERGFRDRRLQSRLGWGSRIWSGAATDM